MKFLFDPMNQRGRIYTLNNDSEIFLSNPYYTFKPSSTVFSFETTQQVHNRLINGEAILHKDCLYKIINVFNELPMYC
jgi:hypothetical protein